MKKILLLTLLLGGMISSSVFGQACSITQVVVKPNITTADGKVTSVDITLTMDKQNPGNKFTYLALWDADNFGKVDSTAFTSGRSPLYANINGTPGNTHPALAVIGVDNFNYNTPTYLITGVNGGYGPDPSNVLLVKGTGQPIQAGSGNGPYVYTFINIPLSVPVSGTIRGLNWSTQANSTNSHIHCNSQTTDLSYQADMFVLGKTDCTTSSYKFSITNPASADGVVNSYAVYADNGNGSFNANSNLLITNSSAPFTIKSGASQGPISNKIPAKFIKNDLWIQVTNSNGKSILSKIPASGCIVALPVVFGTFTAGRVNDAVLLKWQTYTEQNNMGFYIQRYTANEWKDIGLVFSSTADGNSSSVLNYEFKDATPETGISQYRIKQMDKNGKSDYSGVRTVKAEEKSMIKIFPNPSDGAVHVAFETASVRDLTVSDISGRIVKQYSNITSNIITVEGLTTGFYSLKISNRTDGMIKVEKLIVKKR